METQLGWDELLPVLQLERAQIPELIPARLVLAKQLLKAVQVDELPDGVQRRLGDRRLT